MSGGRATRVLLGVLGAVVALRAAIAWLLPMTLDESYYVQWSKALDWGYFDHPPLVALIGSTSRLVASSAFAGRLGALVVSALALPVFAALCRRSGLADGPAFAAALLLFSFNLLGIVGGVLVTPDAALLFAWTLALHEGVVAVERDPRRWISAGAATGLGLLGKYMMALIGPAFLWVLLRRRRDSLRTPWPWLGGLAALLVFAPHLLWNAANGWVPIRFQLAHGFAEEVERPAYSRSELPRPIPDEPDGPEVRLMSFFSGPIDTARKLKGLDEEDSDEVPWVIIGLSEFLGAVLALWGCLLVPLALAAFARFSPSARGRDRAPPSPLAPAARSLLAAATWTPLAVFGFVAARKHIEANWPAIYMVGASVLLAAPLAPRLRSVTLASAANALLLLVLALHGRHPLRTREGDRIQQETRGFVELAERVEGLQPLLFQRHQLGGMLHFYAPDLVAAQWPGVTRPSEFVRRPEWNPYTPADLIAAGGFWYLSSSREVPRMAGFEPVELTQLRYCADGTFAETRAFETPVYAAPCEESRVHTWYLVRYRLSV